MSFLKSLKSFFVYKVYTTGSKILNDLRNSDQRCSIKNVFIKVSQNSLENNCVGVSFFFKLEAWTPPGDCFWYLTIYFTWCIYCSISIVLTVCSNVVRVVLTIFYSLGLFKVKSIFPYCFCHDRFESCYWQYHILY